MVRPALIAVVGGFLGLLCQGDPRDAGFPPLPGPDPNGEVVAVSPQIASSDWPVFYVRDPQNEKRLLAYDWTGSRRGAIEVSASEPFGVYPSEDGTMLLLTHAHIVSGGRLAGRVSNGIWAGDNAHLCSFLNQLGGPGRPRERWISANIMEGIATPATLFYQSANGGSTRLLDYGAFGSHGGPAVLACSAANDRAVIGGSFVATLSGLTMVRLSDGHVMTEDLGGPHRGADGTVVSSDGTLLALGSTGGVTMGNASDAFTVFRIPGNKVVAEISGSRIRAFSADGSRVLTAQQVGQDNERERYQVIELATSRTLWSAILSPGSVRTRPGSGDFLVESWSHELSLTRSNATDTFADVWLVSAGGSARLLLERVSPIG